MIIFNLFYFFLVHADQGYGRLQGWNKAQGLAAVLRFDGCQCVEDCHRMHATAAKLSMNGDTTRSWTKLKYKPIAFN